MLWTPPVADDAGDVERPGPRLAAAGHGQVVHFVEHEQRWGAERIVDDLVDLTRVGQRVIRENGTVEVRALGSAPGVQVDVQRLDVVVPLPAQVGVRDEHDESGDRAGVGQVAVRPRGEQGLACAGSCVDCGELTGTQ